MIVSMQHHPWEVVPHNLNHSSRYPYSIDIMCIWMKRLKSNKSLIWQWNFVPIGTLRITLWIMEILISFWLKEFDGQFGYCLASKNQYHV